MPCRVGITTRPEERKAEWERKVAGMRNWQIIGQYASKGEAQAHEDRKARAHGCQSSHGGDGSGTWYVYHFEYARSM